MDIFKMANEIASNMSNDEKNSMDEMDMEKMLSHVTKNVFKMMNGLNKIQDEQSDPKYSNSICGPENTGNEGYKKTKDICFDLNVDLEDFYTGKKKKLNVRRKRITEVNGKEIVIEEKKKLIIPIEKGMKDGTKIKFQGEADHIPGFTPGDVIINLIENEHEYFQRDEDNLVIVKNINLCEVYSLSFKIKHLDSSIIKIVKDPQDSLNINETIRKVVGKGMPLYKKNCYGDLFIRFNIVIPKFLTPSNLELLDPIFNKKVAITEVMKKYEMIDSISGESVEEFKMERTDDADESDVSDVSSESESQSESESGSGSDNISKELNEINSDSD
jgi:DnaJ-class molecular chaperone